MESNRYIDRDVSLDWTHTNQPSTASTVLQTITFRPTGRVRRRLQRLSAGYPFTPTAALVCGTRNTVGTPLWQANLNPATTRLLYGPAVTNTGNIDTTYATGQNFDKLDSYGGALTMIGCSTRLLRLRSITGWRRCTGPPVWMPTARRSISSN